MAATPKAGVLVFKGLQSGASIVVPLYNPDVAGTYVRLDNGNGTPTSTTTGSDFITFNENVMLIDASLVTGIADTVNMRIMVDYKPTQFYINWQTWVNSLANRPPISIGFSAGRRISLLSTI